MIPETTHFLKDILFHLPTRIYWKNPQGQYQWCNGAHLEALGLSSLADLQGKTDFELLWKEQAPALRQVDEAVMQTRTPYQGEETVPLANGDTAVFLSHKTPLTDTTGTLIGMLGVSMDITLRKHLEQAVKDAQAQAQTAAQVKTDFLDNLRHDIRTPLSEMQSLACLMSAEQEPEKIHAYAQQLVQAHTSLLLFLNRILDVIQRCDHPPVVAHQPILLEPLLRALVEEHHALAREKHLTLTFTYDARLPPEVMGDAARLQRLTTELLHNALKFTTQGTVSVSATLHQPTPHAQGRLHLTVSDTGIGIPPEQHAAIFKPFTRLTPAYHGVYAGVGLGLTQVQEEVWDLKGEIRVESTLHHGSTFICDLPLQAAVSSPVHDSPADGEVCPSPPRILLVEDSPLIAKGTALLLQQCGCEVDIAENGHAALAAAHTKAYAFMLMDLGLPDMSGYDVTQQIRAQEKPVSRVPIIALTAHAGPDALAQCQAAGLDALVIKPLSEAHARALLQQFVSHKK